MALTDKSERQLLEMIEEDPTLTEPDIEIELDETVEPDGDVYEMEDGSAVVSFGKEEEYSDLPEDHYANLAEYMDSTELTAMASELHDEIKQDLASRSEWEHTLTEALKQLGFKMEEKNTPWPGACSVVHPLMSEAIIRFQSDTISNILPPQGPVKGTVLGLQTKEKVAQAYRVGRYMNHVVMNEMEEYRPETERLLFGLALNGASFRKIYDNPVTAKPKSAYIPAQDLIVNNDATDLRTADRITHRMRVSKYEVDRLMRVGFYRDTGISDPALEESAIERAIDDLVGMETVTTDSKSRVLYECQCYWDLGEGDGYLPYIVTIDDTDMTVLSIYRNWDPDDAARQREEHIVHYEFIPGLGFYGFGYAHLIGNTAKAATAILQQLVDAGTMANVPGGLKSRGARMVNDDGPITPGEWRDVDVPSSKISDHFMPAPTKEPSATLFQLMQSIVEDGRRLGSMVDARIDDMNERAAVGTTLAIMERSQLMQTAIQRRVHAGLKREFQILARIISNSEVSYPYDTEEEEGIAQEDFDDRVDVLPVSDPESSSLSHRMMKYQALLTASQQAPDVFDRRELNRRFVEAVGLEDSDKLVPMPEDIEAMDPISENSTILNLGKVAAKLHQDHEAHLRVHLALQKDPGIQQMLQNSPSGAQVAGTLDAHIREHLAFQMRRDIEKEMGVELPPPGQPLPEDVEARISRLAADAADQVTGKKAAQAAAQKAAQEAQDPMIQMKQAELQLRAAETQRKATKDQMDFARHQQKTQTDTQLRILELAQQAEQAQESNDLEKAKMILGQIQNLVEIQQRELEKGIDVGLEVSRATESGGE